MAKRGWHKPVGWLLALVLLVFLPAPGVAAAAEAGALRVLASTFPIYLFTLNVCKGAENVEVELLVPAQAGCPHDFALKPADLRKLSRASVLVINGHDLEEFLEKALANPPAGQKLIVAGKDVPVLPAAVSSHGHEHGNPHIFAAPAEAALMVRNIGEGMAQIDAANAALYRDNAGKFAAALEKLSAAFSAIGARAANKKIVIAHDGLAYLAKNAGLEIIAILENSDSLARLAALKKQFAKEAPALIAGDAQYPDRLPEALARETGIPFARLDTSASGPQNPPPDFYQKAMEENLAVLEKYFE